METIAITGQSRTGLGKKPSKDLRNDGRIPCVLYGGQDVVHFSVTLNDVKTLIYTPDFRVANLTVDGATYRCIVKDYQLHPLTSQLTHIDFLSLVEGQKVKLEVPVRTKGVSPGVKLGGKLQIKLRRAKVKTLPEQMVTELFIDITSMDLGHSLRVRDIIVPEGIELLNAPSIPVVTIEIPRALRSAAAAEAKETGKKKK
ncbi:MAG TPA: 50S ribosomal protein L25 [Haliscomenobacter sp.]|uniref:50S ribosomal protein L25 n=1 Tax=Haliscomenobacter sp. TaxID=2717303 RepID=UPI001D7D8B4B|nr:50S ribosomal protein L25 [Haliscomenobacter sp.]MBK9492422.1 50S ribosomal protein L25 [Haliscomenobacter sp.]HOY17220.1 50S ribosomal protein L25 [Haliscomenobacter sp.]HPH17227.1 50S ribosomal protein L25 [Haliscomenobacter sp.]